MKYFFIPSATHVLDEPIEIEEEPFKVSHYSRSYYVAAASDLDARRLIELDAKTERASVLSVEAVDETSLDKVPRPKAGQVDPRVPGVLWRSGRAFFPAS